ncbi:MAG: hypothetical protein M9965_08205, partial [Anaerolineae bacterium]|nr:hypothetical protein [Anaerolineae bacterium]
MKQSDPSRNRQSDSALISVYRTQMQQSAEMPWLAALLLKRARRLQNRTSYFRRQLNGLPRRWRRRLQRAFATGIVGAAFLLALGPTPSIHAATITVDPGASGIVVDGYCSLVEAIHNANDTTTGQPYGDCDTGDPAGADTIVLTGNTYTYTITYGTDSALPDITSDITITGSGSTIERDGAAANFRLMKVNGGGNLTLNQVTLSGGDLNATGGGLYVNIGEATINNSTISGNSANNGGGVGVFPRGTLTINNSTISGNSAGAGGGISAAKFGDNNATGINVTINNSTISGNTAGDGGGIRVLARAYYALAQVAVMVNNSTISGNSAANGGGIHNYTYNYGGYPSQATITLNNSTITGNSAANGGGVYNRRVSGTADITLHRSLVSGNAASASGDELAALGGGNIYLADYNLLGDSSHTNAQAFSGATPGASDITATIDGTNPTHISDILDTTLANNGGPTLTHALVPVSPAVDEAPAAACAAAPIDGLDQTGATRAGGPGNGGNECDIGAVEYANPSYPTEISPTPGAAGLNGYDGCSLVEAIITANTDVPTGGCLDVGGADTIPLAGNTYTYTAAYGYFAALPDITSEVTIAGNDSTIERDGGAAGNFRIMRVTSSGNLTLNQTTLTGGDFGAAGGGLAIYSGDATLNNSTISGNSASNGGGIAVLNRGTLTINNSTVSGNSAGSGGGIWARKGGDNNPTGINVTVNNSTISSNSASYGGGIFSRAESYYADTLVAVTVNNSTISGNTAIQKGGGIFNFAYDYSGHPTQALVTLNNSTITGNSAANGGGVYTGRLSGTASTYLHRSLVSGNSAGTGDELASAGGGNIYLADYNLLGDSSHTNAEAFYYASPGASDITATSNGTNPTHLSDILVTTLANNGGPTLTHALVPVSPAVDEAPAAACAASPINGLDQTGATR